jgi:hypothetical protein
LNKIKYFYIRYLGYGRPSRLPLWVNLLIYEKGNYHYKITDKTTESDIYLKVGEVVLKVHTWMYPDTPGYFYSISVGVDGKQVYWYDCLKGTLEYQYGAWVREVRLAYLKRKD